MVVYLSCEYFNSKYFTHIFIIKNSIIHIHLPDFTSKRLILFKNTIYNIRQDSFRSILFFLTNSVVQIQQKIQHFTSRNCRNGGTDA